MSTQEVFAIVKRRGLKIILNDGRPEIVRMKGNTGVTDCLLAVLKRHREQIIETLSKEA